MLAVVEAVKLQSAGKLIPVTVNAEIQTAADVCSIADYRVIRHICCLCDREAFPGGKVDSAERVFGNYIPRLVHAVVSEIRAVIQDIPDYRGIIKRFRTGQHRNCFSALHIAQDYRAVRGFRLVVPVIQTQPVVYYRELRVFGDVAAVDVGVVIVLACAECIFFAGVIYSRRPVQTVFRYHKTICVRFDEQCGLSGREVVAVNIPGVRSSEFSIELGDTDGIFSVADIIKRAVPEVYRLCRDRKDLGYYAVFQLAESFSVGQVRKIKRTCFSVRADKPRQDIAGEILRQVAVPDVLCLSHREVFYWLGNILLPPGFGVFRFI